MIFSPVLFTIKHFLTSGQLSRAVSVIFLRGIFFPPLTPSSAVITNSDLQSNILPDIESAENSLQTALELGVKQDVIYNKLAEVQSRKGDVEQAVDSIKQAMTFGADYEFTELEAFAQIFIKREAWQSVLEVFLIMDKMQPNNTDTFVNIALTYNQLGDKEQATIWINKILEIDPSMQDQVNEFISNL